MLAVAFAAAGCAQQPGLVATMPGIDNVIYGPGPAVGPAPGPAPAGRGLLMSNYNTPGPSPDGRGLLMSSYATSAPVVGRGLPMGGFVAVAPPPGVAPAPVNYGPPPGVAPTPINYGPPPGYQPVGIQPVLQGPPYTLDSGDRLRVVVFGQDGLTNSYVVDASGRIDMPLIGSVLARGATSDELQNRIAEQLSQGYIREPHVSVEIEAYRPFFILGEVTAPGQYPYVANMTVETAVAIAGGFGPRGQRTQVVITRNMGGRPVRFGAPVAFPLRPGDTIVVQERWF
jgi:polysaccharide export outer membrane protein